MHSEKSEKIILRVVDLENIGEVKPLEISKGTHPKAVSFPNAQGGLRRITHGEVAGLANNTGERLLKAFAKA